MTVTFRNLIRQKGYSIINILGLSLGLAAAIAILLVVRYELSFESSHLNAEHIYRINSRTTLGGTANELAVSPAALAPALRESIPGLEGVTRVADNGQLGIELDNRILYTEEGAAMVDPDFLRMFTMPLISGNPETALDDPNSILLTEAYARKVFGTLPEVGKQIVLSDGESYKLTGLLKDPPSNTMFNNEMYLSIASAPEQFHQIWGQMNLLTFVQLHPDTPVDEVAIAAEEQLKQNIGDTLERLGIEWEMFLYPFRDIHLHSATLGDPDTNIPMSFVTGFSAIALFILLLACINFINLSTARSARRAREVGVRKVMGANRDSLIRQFLGESTLYALISTILAFTLVLFALPWFRSMTGRLITSEMLFTPGMLIGLISIVLTVGLVSGAFPAFFLSAFQPVDVLKKGQLGAARGLRVRQVLVVGQFVVSIALILGTLTTFDQLRYLQLQDLGFDKQQVLTLRPQRQQSPTKLKTFKEYIGTLPGISSVSMGDSSPFGSSARKTVVEPEGTEDGDKLEIWVY
jgi:putative ABC transport system permease protein